MMGRSKGYAFMMVARWYGQTQCHGLILFSLFIVDREDITMQSMTYLKKRTGLFSAAVGLAVALSSVSSHALDVRVGKWKDAWDASKQEFEQNSDKKKPSKKFLGIRLGSGLEKAAAAADKAYAELAAKPFGQFDDKTGAPALSDKTFEKDLANLNSKVADFRKAAKKYLAELKDADTEDPNGDYATELKVLAGHLEAIEGQMMGQPDLLKTGREHNRVKVQARLEGKTDDEVKEARSKAKTVESFFVPTLGAIKKARGNVAEAQKFMKTYAAAQDKDKQDTFGDLNTRARDVSQNMVNLTKAGENSNYTFKQDPAALATEWARWGNAPMLFSTLKVTSTAQEAGDMIRNFEALLNQTQAWVENEQKK
jgi:hypothetical protein